jgi:hypothetical protein
MLSKENSFSMMATTWDWIKKHAVNAKIIASIQIDNHLVRSIHNRLKSLEISYENLKKEHTPELPLENSITPENAKEILHHLSHESKICAAESKGNLLNQHIQQCKKLLEENSNQINCLPEENRPIIPELSTVTEETIAIIERGVLISKVYSNISTECSKIKASNILEAQLTPYFKTYGINGYRFAKGQFENSTIKLGESAALASRGVANVLNAVGTIVNSSHLALIDINMGEMRLFIPDAGLLVKHQLIVLMALKAQAIINEKEFTSLYYGYFFDAGRTCLTPEHSFDDYQKQVAKNKGNSKSLIISISCSAYLLEKNVVFSRDEVINFIVSNKDKLDPIITKLIDTEIPPINVTTISSTLFTEEDE